MEALPALIAILAPLCGSLFIALSGSNLGERVAGIGIGALQVHGELFRSGEALLRGEIERVLNAKVGPITSRLDAAAGITTITIHLQESPTV
jgi:hypothetical protein